MREWNERPEYLLDPRSEDSWLQLKDLARVQGSRAWLALLRDRLSWNAAPIPVQDEAIESVQGVLGERFVFRGTENFECGGAAHRIASFRYLGPDLERPLKSAGPLDWVFRLVPGGRFMMGSPDSEAGRYSNEGPLRQRTCSPVLVAATPTTRGMWSALRPSVRRRGDSLEAPIESTTFKEMSDWINSLGGQLQLPGELEWEYACRAGTQSRFYFGDDAALLPDYAWFNENFAHGVQNVARKRPNAFGLYDVHGNAFELCRDPWVEDYAEPPGQGNFGRSAVPACARRGGSWLSDLGNCRSASRSRSFQHLTGAGFRLFRIFHF